MSEEEKLIEIINKIRDSITDNENIYLLCDSLEDIIKNNKQSYDIQIVVNSLLNYTNKLQEENEELEKTLKQTQDSWFKDTKRLDKLQKENEELKEQLELTRRDNAIISNRIEENVEKNYISKDKLKEALGDKNIPDEMILTYIETLVSENNRLEDIEDRKVQIEYNNVFNKGVKSVEDKIRTKIKELQNAPLVYGLTIEVLEELLGDE